MYFFPIAGLATGPSGPALHYLKWPLSQFSRACHYATLLS